MKTSNQNKPRHRGYAALLTTLTLSLTVIAFAFSAFRESRQAHRVQAVNQVKIDYSQKERAFLRALLNVVPNAAMQNMMQGSSNALTNNDWSAIFTQALTQAQSDQALDTNIQANLGISATVISSNTGDSTFLPSGLVTSPDGSGNFVFRDDANNTTGLNFPPRMEFDGSPGSFTNSHPVVSLNKRLQGSSTDFSEIPYPDIAFGYANQGSTFIARRNWWAFTLNFGSNSESISGIAPTPRTYVLSIYEVPTQLAISSSGNTTSIGQFKDGSNWDLTAGNISVAGSIYAEKAQIEDLTQVVNNTVSSRRGVTLGTTGQALGTLTERREERATSNTFFAYSSSSDSGMVAFTSIDRGTNFFDYFANTTAGQRNDLYFSSQASSTPRVDYLSDPATLNTISPTSWNEYSVGARQTKIKVEIGATVAADIQVPTRVFVSARFDNDTVTRRQQCTRGVWWRLPTETGFARTGQSWPATPDGSDWFVQTRVLSNGRPCITLDLEKLPEFLRQIGADGTTTNNSIWIGPRAGFGNVREASFPSLIDDTALLIESSQDLSGFPEGLTIVTPMRVFFNDNFNTVAVTPPAGSGIPEPWFPPVSVYAPEKRFGIQTNSGRKVDIEGQLGFLPGSTSTGPIHPLNFKEGGNNASVITSDVLADLKGVTRIEDLPPINAMSWLTVIEEVHN